MKSAEEQITSDDMSLPTTPVVSNTSNSVEQFEITSEIIPNISETYLISESSEEYFPAIGKTDACLLNFTNFSTTDVVHLTVFVAISLLCIGNNGILLYSYVKSKKIQILMGSLLTGLAITDLATGILSAPVLILVHSPCKYLNENPVFIDLGYALCAIPQNNSMLLLLAVAFERYVYVVHSTRYKSIFSPSRLKVLVVMIWIYSVGSTVLYLTFKQPTNVAPNVNLAFVTHLKYLGVQAATILVLNTGLYVGIWRAAHKARRRIQASGHGTASTRNKIKQQRKTTQILVTVMAAFYCSYLPGLLLLFDSVRYNPIISTYVKPTAFVLANSFVNPIIYVVMNPAIRKCLLEVLCACRITKQTPVANINVVANRVPN